MRRGRIVTVAVVGLASLGAGDAPRSVSVADPCGDLGTVATPAGPVSTQPEDWDRNDLTELTLSEVRDDAGEVAGVDLVIEVCDTSEAPKRPGEYVEVRWPLSDSCWASAAVGHGGNSVRPASNTGLEVGPDRARFSVRCMEPVAPYDLVATVVEPAGVDLAPARVRWDGPTLEISLRGDELGDLATLIADGETIADAIALSYAMTGTTVAFGFGASDGSVGSADWTAPAPALTLGG